MLKARPYRVRRGFSTLGAAAQPAAAWARSPGAELGRAVAAWRREDEGLPDKSKLRARLWLPEAAANEANLRALKAVGGAALSGEAAEARVQADASALVRACRAPGARGTSSPVQALLHEYSLSSREGVTLLGLAEALLRVRSPEGRSRLIADKLSAVSRPAASLGGGASAQAGSWIAGHVGASKPLVVNAAATALAAGELFVGARERLTSSLGANLGVPLGELLSRLGEPTIRLVVVALMRKLGDEFVLVRAASNARAARRGPHGSRARGC